MTDFDIDRYKQWCEAYPEDIFTPLKGDPVKKTEDYDTPEKNNLITRASAAMGRHMIERCVRPMIEQLESLVAELHGTVTTEYHDKLMGDWQRLVVSKDEEIEKLTALTAADGEEIGSYRGETGLRGESMMAEKLMGEVEMSGGLKCPNCEDVGFTAEQDGHGEWYQEQCEFCWTCQGVSIQSHPKRGHVKVFVVDDVIGTSAYIGMELQPKVEGATYMEREAAAKEIERLTKALDEMSQFRRLRGISPETLAVLDSIAP